jgi:GGDEF domain-containing protein
MISIKRLWEGPSGEAGTDRATLLDASLHLRRLLVEGQDTQNPLGPEDETPDNGPIARDLLIRLEGASSPLEILGIANEALEAAQGYTRRATGYFREQRGQMRSMVAMLTGTLADISGESEASVARLREVERQIERASTLDNIQGLRDSLASCLTAVKEAAVQQKKANQATIERLRENLKAAIQPASMQGASSVAEEIRSAPVGNAEYVAAIRLQRADHIVARFGEGVREQMLTLVGEGLKSLQSPHDRLMRWKGPSFVMFISSAESISVLRRRLAAAVARIGQRYVEVGRNSALLAVGVDWVVFAQAQFPSPDMLFREVDLFLGVDSR